MSFSLIVVPDAKSHLPNTYAWVTLVSTEGCAEQRREGCLFFEKKKMTETHKVEAARRRTEASRVVCDVMRLNNQ